MNGKNKVAYCFEKRWVKLGVPSSHSLSDGLPTYLTPYIPVCTSIQTDK